MILQIYQKISFHCMIAQNLKIMKEIKILSKLKMIRINLFIIKETKLN